MSKFVTTIFTVFKIHFLFLIHNKTPPKLSVLKLVTRKFSNMDRKFILIFLENARTFSALKLEMSCVCQPWRLRSSAGVYRLRRQGANPPNESEKRRQNTNRTGLIDVTYYILSFQKFRRLGLFALLLPKSRNL